MDDAIAGGEGRGADAGIRAWLLALAMLALAWLPSALVVAALAAAALAWGPRWAVAGPFVLLAAGAVRAAREHGRLPGRAVEPEAEQELTALVRGVAERLGFREPLLVRVVPEVQASLGPARVAGARAYVLLLGLPLLRGLTEAQLASVVAHELGHRQHLGDRRMTLLRFARGTLADRLDRRVRPLAPLAAPLLRASQPLMWRAELAADADAVHVAGSAACAQALRRTAVLHAAFEGLGGTWWSALAEEGACPADFYDALDTALADPHVAARAARVAAEEDALDPYAASGHPPVTTRIAALPAGPGEPPGTYRDTPLVLRDAAALARWCVAELAGVDGEPTDAASVPPGRKPDRYDGPRPVRLLELDAERLHGLHDDTGLTLLLYATRQEEPAPALVAALDTVADGSWPRLARRLEPGLRWMPSAVRPDIARRAFAGALAAALAPLLRDSGWTYPSRWLNSVLTSPDGTTLDLQELAWEAVADPGPLRALLAAPNTRTQPAA
ncbi:M48 family metalloprotease [Streptomyces sp. NPDC052682]|uniref:M48 family metalloprotease n=1 Tax=Streptomyces sp. NPDC052682 TaxID=3154954 RepID=UPI00343B69F6